MLDKKTKHFYEYEFHSNFAYIYLFLRLHFTDANEEMFHEKKKKRVRNAETEPIEKPNQADQRV